MTMHLEGPWLSTTGKRKGKIKYKSAEAKRQAEQLARDWEALKTRHKSAPVSAARPTAVKKSSSSTSENVENRPKSLGSWITGPVSSKPSQHYTGDNVKGITVMHKSCLQPVFSNQEAIDAAHMRR